MLPDYDVIKARRKVIVQATHESVDNLATSTCGRKFKIAANTLKAILVLLDFHSKEKVRQMDILVIEEPLIGEQISFTPG